MAHLGRAAARAAAVDGVRQEAFEQLQLPLREGAGRVLPPLRRPLRGPSVGDGSRGGRRVAAGRQPRVGAAGGGGPPGRLRQRGPREQRVRVRAERVGALRALVEPAEVAPHAVLIVILRVRAGRDAGTVVALPRHHERGQAADRAVGGELSERRVAAGRLRTPAASATAASAAAASASAAAAAAAVAAAAATRGVEREPRLGVDAADEQRVLQLAPRHGRVLALGRGDVQRVPVRQQRGGGLAELEAHVSQREQ